MRKAPIIESLVFQSILQIFEFVGMKLNES